MIFIIEYNHGYSDCCFLDKDGKQEDLKITEKAANLLLKRYGCAIDRYEAYYYETIDEILQKEFSVKPSKMNALRAKSIRKKLESGKWFECSAFLFTRLKKNE
jgi:hypothetical protein